MYFDASGQNCFNLAIINARLKASYRVQRAELFVTLDDLQAAKEGATEASNLLVKPVREVFDKLFVRNKIY
jgi:hypothetical protein